MSLKLFFILNHFEKFAPLSDKEFDKRTFYEVGHDDQAEHVGGAVFTA